MRSSLKQIFSALLAAVLMLPLAACNSNEPDAASDTPISETTSNISSETETENPSLRKNAKDNLPDDLDLIGTTINVLAWDHMYSRYDLFGDEELSGDIVFNAINNRNNIVEERLNCVINTMLSPDPKWADFASLIQKTVSAGDDVYSIILGMGNSTIQYGNDKYFMDVSGLKYLDFDQPWWWKESIDELSLDGKTYLYLVGDMQLSNYLASGAVYFNKRLYENAIGSSDALYELVINGGWTWDKLHEYCETGSQDLNGDGELTEDDLMGSILGHSVLLGMMEYTADVRRSSRDENGYVQLDYDLERAATITQKLYNLLYETKGFRYDKDNYTKATAFSSGKMLFYIERLNQATSAELRDMEDDYGIIPMAKADDTQTEYMSLVQNAAMNVAIPVTCSNPDDAAAVLEALNAESYRSVVESFYETALKNKYSRDSYSGQCIDMIANSAKRFVIYEYTNQWANAGTLISDCVAAKNTDFASAYAKKAAACEKAMTKYMETFEKQKTAG